MFEILTYPASDYETSLVAVFWKTRHCLLTEYENLCVSVHAFRICSDPLSCAFICLLAMSLLLQTLQLYIPFLYISLH